MTQFTVLRVTDLGWWAVSVIDSTGRYLYHSPVIIVLYQTERGVYYPHRTSRRYTALTPDVPCTAVYPLCILGPARGVSGCTDQPATAVVYGTVTVVYGMAVNDPL